MRRHLIAAMMVAIVLMAALTGCQTKPQTSGEPKTPATLSMFCVSGNMEPLFDQFTADTGIKVEYLTMTNGETLERLKNEKRAGVSTADIWFTGGSDTFVEAAQAGLFVAYESPEGAVLPESMRDPNGYWYGTTLTLVNLVVNTNLIEAKGLKMPEVWDDLLQPGLKGEVSCSNPASSGTAFNTAAAMLQIRGEEEGWAYLEALMGQVPFFTPRGSDPANNVVNGEAIVGINPSNGDRALEKQYDFIKLVYPADGTGWWPQPVAIIDGTKKLSEAKKFIDWILSEKGMQAFAAHRGAAVGRPGIEAPEGIVNIDDIKLFPIDFRTGAEQRQIILEEWDRRLATVQK